MDRENAVKILEVCKVSPLPNSLNPSSASVSASASRFSLSLTSFDYTFLNFPPMLRLLFYPHTDSDTSIFFDSIVPKLKRALSLTLQHFLPVAGNLVWPENSPKPFILYTPNDGVSFTVAETDFDFNHFSRNQAREIKEYRSLTPTVEPSDTQVPILCLQVTKFPNGGFSIAFVCHHVLFDGFSVGMFLKSWAHICKLNDLPESLSSLLPDELTPSFDRDSVVFQTPSALIPQTKSLKFSSLGSAPTNWFHGAFELTRTHIEKLKKRVLEKLQNSEDLHLSTFVVVYAYVLTCLVEAQQEEMEQQKFIILLTADARGRVEPPISSNYFGNCLSLSVALGEERKFVEEDGLPNIAKKISDLVLKVKKTGHRGEEKHYPSLAEKIRSSGIKIFSVGASPKFQHYKTDFGWGKPKKIQLVSMGENNISLQDASDGGGGVEVGIVLQTLQQMDTFASLFNNGLN